MSTPCESVYDVFFDLIEEDRDFFNYYEATDEESYMLALQRAKALLRDAAIRMQMECDDRTGGNLAIDRQIGGQTLGIGLAGEIRGG